jgi:trans-aconitate methyltransferase
MGETPSATRPNGGAQPTWNAALYQQRHAFVWKSAADLVELLAPQEGERIVDLGCGTGELTAIIASSNATVVGIDASEEMLAAARKAHPHVQFIQADARSFRLDEPVDAVFSNATLHWVRPPEQVVASIAHALKPGGRFVAEFGGCGNVRAIIEAMGWGMSRIGRAFPKEAGETWHFPSIGEYTSLLERYDLEPVYATLFDRPTPLEGENGLRNWMAMFAEPYLRHAPAEQREEVIKHTEAHARPLLYRDGTWFADYRRIRVFARKRA